MNYKNILSNQPTINVGIIGSVSNGKSSITEKITGIKTQKHSKELEKNITIKLGYANAKIYKCNKCPPPQCYQPYPSGIMKAFCKLCNEELELIKHISFVDTPGHNLLMSTMLNGTCVMDYTILVESAGNPSIAQQTKEHLIATKITNLKNVITCLNKLDLVKKPIAKQKLEKLKEELQTTTANDSPIIPLSANHEINIDVLCEYICRYIPEPERDLNQMVKMIVIRSFNINKQNIEPEYIEGGVVGGTLVSGVLHVNDQVCIYPGYVLQNMDKKTEAKWRYKPLICKVLSINSEKNDLDFAIPGGLIGVKLDIDPGLTTKDNLIGNIITLPNIQDYKICERLLVKLKLIKRDNITNIKMIIQTNEIIELNINACNVKAEIIHIEENKAELLLIDRPICIKLDDYITISKKVNDSIILLGRAIILDIVESEKL